MPQDTLEDKVNESFLDRTLTKIRNSLYSAKVGLAALITVSSIILPQQAQARAPPDWTVEVTSVITNSNQVTFEYKITNTSTNHSDYRLLTLTIGAGTNEINKITEAYGGRQFDYDWAPTLRDSYTLFDSYSGQPINPAGDDGFFQITSSQTNGTGLINFDAESNGAGDFPTKQVLGPVKNYLVTVISTNSLGQTIGNPTPGTRYYPHGSFATQSVDTVVNDSARPDEKRYRITGYSLSP